MIIIAGKIQLYPPSLYKKGMEIVTVATTRNHHNAGNPAIKSLNYLNNIMAKIEANIAGTRRRSCSMPRATWPSDRRQYFHPQGQPNVHASAFVRSATRHHAWHGDRPGDRPGLLTSEPNLTRYDLYNADECFPHRHRRGDRAGGED
ncbi:MAG: hypothetical protein CM1200mP29_17430 [Verrucomicrobiota bacterium]|nr:MAG: hypothetical protein CM1200mP29_17430 [Verrucomicrobiota bacterium]